MFRFFIFLSFLVPIFCGPNKIALRKILIDENPDTEDNREKIREILEKASNESQKVSIRIQGRQSLKKMPARVDLGPENNQTTHEKFEHINKEIDEYTFESDIMLNEEQANAIANGIKNKSGREKRQTIIAPSLFWNINTPIYYQFDTKLTSSNVANVRKAIQYWQDNSCLSFQESSTGPNRLFLTSAGGCWSYVGKQTTSSQLVSVGPGCDGLGTATHELAHALGVWHMQSRADRDQYVTIDFSNIFPAQRYNFDKMTEQQAPLLGLPFDYGSVMQYYPYSFAIDRTKYTIYANSAANQNSLGQREGPAFSDVRLINKLYKCSEQRCGTQLTCSNFGFTDPKRCSQCKCPRYFGGQTCDELNRGSAVNCNGQVITATSTWSSFNGKAGDPNSYVATNTATDCYWHVKAPVGQRVELRLTKSLSSSICMQECPWQSIEINMGKFDVYGMIMCCSAFVNQIFTSDANIVAIRAKVQYNQADFIIQYRAVSGSG